MDKFVYRQAMSRYSALRLFLENFGFSTSIEIRNILPHPIRIYLKNTKSKCITIQLPTLQHDQEKFMLW